MPISPTSRALNYFHQGYSCAQSLFAAFAPQLGIEENMALRLASPFGAGIGRMRGICGAFSGLAMVYGILYGNTSPYSSAKETVYTDVQKMAAEFKARHGSLDCRELLGVPEEAHVSARPEERTAAYYASRPCEDCLRTCAMMGERLINGFSQ